MRPHPTDANSKFSFGAGIREAAYNYFSGGMEVIGHFMTRDTSIKKMAAFESQWYLLLLSMNQTIFNEEQRVKGEMVLARGSRKEIPS